MVKSRLVSADWKDTQGLYNKFVTAVTGLGLFAKIPDRLAGDNSYSVVLSDREMTQEEINAEYFFDLDEPDNFQEDTRPDILFRRMVSCDWNGLAGAEGFPSGRVPFIMEFSYETKEGRIRDCQLVADANGAAWLEYDKDGNARSSAMTWKTGDHEREAQVLMQNIDAMLRIDMFRHHDHITTTFAQLGFGEPAAEPNFEKGV